MKRFFIFYIIFSILVMVVIYFATIVIEMNGRLNFLREDLALQSAEANDPDIFIKFQSVAYRKLDDFPKDDYHFHIYQVIAKRNDLTFDTLIVFVIPKEDVKTADILKDSEDQTQIIIKNATTSQVIYQTVDDEDYDNYAISYGIGRVGLYYHAVEYFDYTLRVEIELYDYDKNMILTHEFDYMHAKDESFDEDLLLPAYTQQEVESLLNLRKYTSVALLENYTIFLILDISVGTIIYHFMKKKKL